MSAPRIPDAAYRSAFLVSSPGEITEHQVRKMVQAAAKHIQRETLLWFANSAMALADIANMESRLSEARGWRDAAADARAKAELVERLSQLGGDSRVG